MPTTTQLESLWPIIFHLRPGARLSEPDDFFAFCQDNEPWRFERTAQGGLIVKMPTGGESGARNLYLSMLLGIWAMTNREGIGFDSNTGFELPGGAMRAPDAAWVRKDRLSSLTAEQKEKFLPLAPDFVVELRSRTDRLKPLQEKMAAWRDDGVRLGLLLDPDERQVHLYRPGADPVILADPASVDCSPELPGFALDTRALFDLTV